MASRKIVFVCACLGMLLFGISLITLGSVATALQNKFQLDALASGTLFSILPIGILGGSLLFGPFSDRYGYRLVLILSSLFIFAGFQGIAFSSTLFLLKVSVFLFGLGGGAINGATNAVVADITTENKGANLSLLGVFYAIGALGMPVVLGALERRFSFETIVSAVGYIPMVVCILCLTARFPAPKQAAGIPLSRAVGLLRESALILIGFFLFCVSSFEAIINNWTTTYLLRALPAIVSSQALYALSLYVVGMAGMRLLLGSIFRPVSARVILAISFVCLVAGCLLLHSAVTYAVGVTGLIFIGIGLAAGFPVMLGITGALYADVSGTAFSIVLAIALVGNMLVNFAMGFVAEKFGIEHLTTLAFTLLAAMLCLGFVILPRTNLKNV